MKKYNINTTDINSLIVAILNGRSSHPKDGGQSLNIHLSLENWKYHYKIFANFFK